MNPFASRHKGPGFKTPGGDLCETGILLLALSCYIGEVSPDDEDHVEGLATLGEDDGLLNAPDVLLVRLPLPGVHGDATGSTNATGSYLEL